MEEITDVKKYFIKKQKSILVKYCRYKKDLDIE